ncbi:four-carbon acid sugar kinase family protein [Paenibacillus sp. FSL H7-0331]|uniref:four-carbon acid sugar kinase family protein n=1 Tax=Paenibacillus sp. FSL H7-0331 TaxID=1920421 RepID=UPI00096EA4AF|nr:four-carbon acid sugar kinase family protein [Paenibacillus sp. FSL H7-0331]OMF20867.1 hypothetical protein BK127_02190 [Paenibacillus sp. FSL H7-0331]
MDNVIILSDDLTGANDSGVQFAKHGMPTVVCIDDRQVLTPANSGTTCVMNVESRSLTPEAAFRKWSELLETQDLSQFQVIMKKIDSTLRGNIGKEIEALMSTGQFDLAIVAPAYPQKGRLTIGGYQLLNQQLLEDSEISRDPKFPITNSKISDIIGAQSSISVGEVEIRSIRSGRLAMEVRTLQQQGTRVIVADSATPNDLQIIAEQFAGERVLWVGSAGLAEALANRYPKLGFHRLESYVERFNVERTQDQEQLADPTAPVLVVAGSVSQVTRQQVETLKLNGFRSLVIDPLLLLGISDQEMAELVQEARHLIASGEDLVVTTDISNEAKVQVVDYLQQAGLSALAGGDLIADGIGRLAAAVITQEKLAGAVLTGGDIAYRACTHLNIASLVIIGEVEEGLPLCKAEGRVSIPLVTKAGAFGNPNSLLQAAQVIRDRK